jgi:hypothetical protein
MAVPEFVTTTTVLGWIFVVGTAYAGYFYYKNGQRRNVRATRPHRVTSNVASEPQRSRAERRPTGTSSSTGGAVKQRKNKPKPEQSSRPAASKPVVYEDYEEPKEDMSWATELAKRKQGTSLSTAPSRQQGRQKTVKQANANKVADQLSAESSTTGGADVDEDSSPGFSPDLRAATNHVAVSGDVKDMLEPASDGPAVLRLTEPERQFSAPKKSAPKPAQQAETKKQRQNKQKAEERKQQQADIEKVRKSQLENQRRTAREARGEPAKNGLGSAPAVNAWTEVPKRETYVANGNPLLDTFVEEKVTTTKAPSKQAALNGSKGGKFDNTSLPSEEEQLRLLIEEDESQWATVTSKKAKSKRQNPDAEDGAVKPVNPKTIAQPTESSSTSNGKYSVLASDEADGWTVA